MTSTSDSIDGHIAANDGYLTEHAKGIMKRARASDTGSVTTVADEDGGQSGQEVSLDDLAARVIDCLR